MEDVKIVKNNLKKVLTSVKFICIIMITVMITIITELIKLIIIFLKERNLNYG